MRFFKNRQGFVNKQLVIYLTFWHLEIKYKRFNFLIFLLAFTKNTKRAIFNKLPALLDKVEYTKNYFTTSFFIIPSDVLTK